MLSFSLITDDGVEMFSQSVPRRLVHKSTVAEVLLTHWESVGESSEDGAFLLGAQWPRDHGVYRPVQAWHDPLLMVETIRQAGLLLAHAAYGVPPGYHFLMSELSYRAEPGSLTIGQHPAEVRLQAACTDVKKRDGVLGGMHLTAAFFRSALPVGVADVVFRCIPPAVYGRIRPLRELGDTAVPEPIDPARVGRDRPRDVVLAAPAAKTGDAGVDAGVDGGVDGGVGGDGAGGRRRGGRRLLRVDRSHPLFFDHPVDHVPGMVVLEAVRQAVLDWHYPEPVLPVAASITFHRYVEHDGPCVLDTHSTGTDAARVTATQGGKVAASAHVTTMPCG